MIGNRRSDSKLAGVEDNVQGFFCVHILDRLDKVCAVNLAAPLEKPRDRNYLAKATS